MEDDADIRFAAGNGLKYIAVPRRPTMSGTVSV
jgi:hypothetical protein